MTIEHYKMLAMLERTRVIEISVLLNNGSHRCEILMTDGTRFIGTLNTAQFQQAAAAELEFEKIHTLTKFICHPI